MPEGFRIASAYVTVDADTDQASRDVDALTAKLAAIPDKTIKLEVSGAAKVEAAVAALKGTTIPISFEVSKSSAATAVARVQAVLNTMTGVTVPVDFEVSQASAAAAIATAKAEIAAAGGVTIPVTFDVSAGSAAALAAAGAQVSGFSRRLSNLTEKAVYATMALAALDVELDRKRAALAGTAIDAGTLGTVIAALGARTAATTQTTADAAAPLSTLSYGWGRAAGAIQLFGGALSGVPLLGAIGAVHLLAQGILELGATIIPASIALASFGVAAVPTVQAITQQMQNLHTAATALNQQMPGLTGGFTAAADAVKPQVYQLFGDMLDIANKNSGTFVKLAQGAGTVLDQLGARFTVAVTNGDGFNKFLHNAVSDLAGWGDLIGNIGGIIGNLLKSMPGYAEVILNVLDGVSHALENITGSSITQHIVGIGLAFHGAAIYVGLLGTAATFLIRGGLNVVGSLAASAAGGLARIGLQGSLAAGAMTQLSGAAGTAAALPWGWITIAAAAVGVLAFKLLTIKDATQQWLGSLQQSLSSANAVQGLTLLQQDQTLVASRLATAQRQVTAATKAGATIWLDSGRAVEHVNIALENAHNTVLDLTAGQQQLNNESNLYNSRLQRIAIAAGGVGAAMGLLNAAGITMKQMLDPSQWAQIVAQVEATTAAYKEMGQQGGILGADMNALNIMASDQVTSMQKLNTAWDGVIGIVSGGQNSFISFEQDMISVNEAFQQTGGTGRVVTNTFAAAAAAAKVAGASMTGTNAASLQLRATWQTAFGGASTLIDSLRMMQSASPGGFPSVTQAAKDALLQLKGFGSESSATRAEMVTLGQEFDPTITNWQQLVKWMGNTKDPAGQLNTLLSKMGINLQNLATDASNLTSNFQSQLISAFNLAKISASGAGTAATQLAKAIVDGAPPATVQQDMETYYLTLRKAGLSAQDANTLISGMTGQIFHGADVIAQTHVTRAQLNTDIENILNNTPGAWAALFKYDGEIRNNAQNSRQGRQDRLNLINDIITAGVKAGDSTGLIATMVSTILKIPKSAAMQIVIDAEGKVSVTGGGIYPTPSGAAPPKPIGVLAAGGAVFGPGGPTDDVIPAMLSAGEYVIPAAAVDYYGLGAMEALRTMSLASGGPVVTGTPGVLSGAYEDNAYNTVKIDGENAAIASLEGALRTADAALAAATTGIGGGVKQWAGAVNQVLQMLEGPGQQPGDVGIVLAQMTTESGGNTAAVNLSDSNARAGHPSTGLMQVIAGTYASYGAPRWGYPPPVAYGVSEAAIPNIYAGMNYAIARYGPSWRNVLGHGHGYGAGGPVAPLRLAKGGGHGPPVLSAEQRTGLAVALALLTGKVTTIATEISTERKLIADIHKYYSGDAAQDKIALVKKQVAALENVTRQLGAVNARIAAARSYESQVQQGLSGYADLSNLTAGSLYTGVGKTVTGPQALSFQLTQKLANLKKFGAALKKLSAAHLDNALFQQIVALGPDAGLQWAQEILADPALIKTLNGEEAQITAAEKSIAQGAASAVYEGKYVPGPNWLGSLKKQQSGLEKIMEHLGDVLGEEAARWFHVPGSRLPKEPESAHHPAPHRRKPPFNPGGPVDTLPKPRPNPGGPVDTLPPHHRKAVRGTVHVEGGIHITVAPRSSPQEQARVIREELAMALGVAP